MELQDIENIVNCAFSDLLDGGEEGCSFDFENLKELRFWKRGYIVAGTVDYNKAYLRTQQQAGNLVAVLGDLYDFSWTTSEDQREQADSTGLSSTTRKGIYGLTFMRRKGLYDQKVINSLDNGNFDVQLVDENGNELWTSTSTGSKGFSTSLIAVNPIAFKNGTTSQKTGGTIEFSRAIEFNKNLSWISEDQLDYTLGEVTGANNVSVKVPTAPSDTDTEVVAKVVLSRGGSFVSGLASSDFLVKVAGATVAISGPTENATDKTYTLTIPAVSTGQVVEVSLYDSLTPSAVVVKDLGGGVDILYKSNTATSVVA